MRKRRGKREVGRSSKSSTPGLVELMTGHGGPTMPTLASPMQEADLDDAPTDNDDENITDEVTIKMSLAVDNIVPSFEGFKLHARQLSPRLQPFLIDRIGHEQVRRYKRLVENKVKHTQAVLLNKNCPSGTHCIELGEKATLLAPQVGAKLQVSTPTESDTDETVFDKDVLTAASFPPGVPVPPVKRFPTEFECPVCFKVKKFQKPADWTRHVYEDVQPFSCTFLACSDPKSFRRRDDWVRHENERHRHLVRWECSIQDCNHVCYRKDSFVQHLVREHKKVEPKVKGRGSRSSKASSWTSEEQEENEVWRLVEECRHETTSLPRDEPCRFCGNVCSTWKKLSIHMSKHMEQIAMPVLSLVSMLQVSPDTTVSPIEQQPARQQTAFGATAPNMNKMDTSNLSPYAVEATSTYQVPSAGHLDGMFYDARSWSEKMQPQAVTGDGSAGTVARSSAVKFGPDFEQPRPTNDQFESLSVVSGGPGHNPKHIAPKSISSVDHLPTLSGSTTSRPWVSRWLAESQSISSHDDRDLVYEQHSHDSGLVTGLYESCLHTLNEIWRQFTRNRRGPSASHRLLTDIRDRLCLWGEGFGAGQLESVISTSSEIFQEVVDLLFRIGHLLVKGASAFSQSTSDSSSTQEQRVYRLKLPVNELKRLLELAASVLHNDDDSGTISSASESEDESDDGRHDSGLYGFLNPLSTYTRLLMDLYPTMERTYADALPSMDQTRSVKSQFKFHVTDAAQSFVLKVHDQFPEAALDLVERLGEANWQRFERVRNETAAVSAATTELPKSLFKPVSLFHDSGLGSSVPTQSQKATSTASHSSFVSSVDGKDKGLLRVPTLPYQGDPFECFVCKQLVSSVKNRIDWK